MTLWMADTSVVVPALLTSHDAHVAVDEALGRRRVRLPMHVAIESYSVLTHLPGDARVRPVDAADLLRERFGTPIELPAEAGWSLIQRFAQLSVAGFAVYDALIGVTATHAGATLLTRDRRAAATYGLLGVTCSYVV